jgi:serine/threonine protein kinase
VIGTLYGGRFRILEQLGSGGMGTVYKAEQVALRREVALKLMHPYLAQAPGQAERFHREAHVLAKLHHKNSVEVYDLGEAEGTLFIAMELLAGNGLDDLLRAGGPMQPQRAIAITAQVLDALSAAHELGVVHRDLKPANVFLCQDGQVKVLDFGLAHAFGQRRLDGGTPAYMAPEQWTGAPEDERTDVFALGVLLHRLVSGALPFSGERGRWRPAPALEVDGAPALGELVASMLRKDPVKRPRGRGAVRKAGNRVRITAQLVNTGDGYQLCSTWTTPRSGPRR